jgi:actin related protein 2/3 complex subunit 2
MPATLTLETYNRIVYQRVMDKLNGVQIKKALKEKLADFNQGLWSIDRPKDGPLTVHAQLSCWSQLKANRAMEYLKEMYGDAVKEENGEYDVCVTIDTMEESKREEFAMKVAKLQTYMLVAPAMMLVKDLKAKKASDKVIQIDYRPGESYWLKAQDGRLHVIFSVSFELKDDEVFGRIFISEMGKGQSGCPSCDVVVRKNVPPPGELKGVKGLSADNCYVSFLLEERHLGKPEHTLELLMTCRNHINYHVKCSKAFLHIRMRNKVGALQLVLNRAKPIREVEKKTASGRTFKK